MSSYVSPWTPHYATGGFNWWPTFFDAMVERSRVASRTGEPTPMTELEAQLLRGACTTDAKKIPDKWWSSVSPVPLFLGRPVVIVDPFGVTW